MRVITGRPYHALFAKTMFIEPTADELEDFEPEALVLHAPEVEADPAADGTRTEVFVVLHPGRNEVLIGGTFYGGEIKKSIFTVMNDRLPLEGVFPMHCSANVDDQGRVAIFFGLSGTGKTTLSADPERSLIGDDEHGWGDSGVFNIEGGCYAKVIRLSAEAEPEIYKTTHTFGTILENVTIDESGVLDLDDDSKTENTRAAYKLEQIGNALPTKQAGHPSAVVMLTADAFGILPPIARLTRDQALFYFLSGYTAKVAGTEIGVTEPQATFSTCFGSPFLPQEPAVYARMLGVKLDAHPRATVWLVNTGWTGGPFGEGHRMPIAATRGLLRAALEEGLRERRVPHRPDLRLRGAGLRARRRPGAPRPALDLARPGGVRPQGPRARADVPRQLREVRRVRRGPTSPPPGPASNRESAFALPFARPGAFPDRPAVAAGLLHGGERELVSGHRPRPVPEGAVLSADRPADPVMAEPRDAASAVAERRHLDRRVRGDAV